MLQMPEVCFEPLCVVVGPDGDDGPTAHATACTGPAEPQPECPDAGDLFYVRDLIKVTALDLDERIAVAGQADSSFRDEGLTMRINLFYDGYAYYYKASTNKIKAKVCVCVRARRECGSISGRRGACERGRATRSALNQTAAC